MSVIGTSSRRKRHAVIAVAVIVGVGCGLCSANLPAEERLPANRINRPKGDEDLLRYREYISPSLRPKPKPLSEMTPAELKMLRVARDRAHERNRKLAQNYLDKFRKTGDSSWVQLYATLDLPSEEVVPELTRLIDDRSHDVRAVAVNWLGRKGPDAADAVPKILEQCRKEPSGSFVIQRAIQAFGHIGPSAAAATPFMVEQFDKRNNSDGLRSDIILSWRKIGPRAKEAIPALEKALAKLGPVLYLNESPERAPPAVASYRLGTYPGVVSDAYKTLGVLRNERPLSVDDLLRAGTKAFFGRDSHRAFQTIRHSELDKDKKVDLLVALLKSRPPLHIHLHALETTRDLQHGTPESLIALFGMLDATDNYVWRATSAAAHACCRGIGRGELRPILMKQLDSTSTRAFVFAVHWLRNNEEDTEFAVRQIAKALQRCFAAPSPEQERIVACLEFLRAKGPKAAEVYPVLLDLLEKSTRLKKQQRDYFQGYLLMTMSQTHIDATAIPTINNVLVNGGQHFEIAAAARAAKALPTDGEKCLPNLIRHLQADYRIRTLRTRDLHRKNSFVEESVTTAREEVIRAIVAIGGEEAQAALPHLRTLAQATGARNNLKKRVAVAAARAVAELSQ